jgi:hypothetical protein
MINRDEGSIYDAMRDGIQAESPDQAKQAGSKKPSKS